MLSLNRFPIKLLILLLLQCAYGAWAQPGSPSPSSTASASPSPTPVAIQLGELTSATEAAAARLHDIEGDLKDDKVLRAVQTDLPGLTRDIDDLTRRTTVEQTSPDLETLRYFEGKWNSLGASLGSLKSSLATRIAKLDQDILQLQRMQVTWSRTLEDVNRPGLPLDLIHGVRATLVSVPPLLSGLQERRGQLVLSQQSISAQESRVKKGKQALKEIRSQAVSRFVVQDSPPLWSAEVRSRIGLELLGAVMASVTRQFDLLQEYLQGNLGPWLVPIVFFAVTLLGLRWARRKLGDHPDLQEVNEVLRSPPATAAVLSILLLRSADPNAPALLLAALGLLAVVPAALLVRRLIDRELWPILGGLVLCNMADQVRLVAASVPLVTRLVLAAEMVLGLGAVALSTLWLQRSGRANAASALRPVSLVMVAVLVTDTLGFVSLATVAATALLKGAYIGVVFYALLRIIDGLLLFSGHVGPVSALNMVKNHGDILRRRIMRWLALLAVLLWTWRLLELLGLRASFASLLGNILDAQFGLGARQVSVGGLIGCIVVIWVARQTSRFARFTLEQEVFPHLALGRGAHYAISTTIHYCILLVGIVLGLSALNVDLTQVSMIAGALSVGIGFGLQNIVKDFVSGLILLFDRRVDVGDTVKIGEYQGELKHIGMRSSILTVGDGSVVVLPNSELINNRVVNWSFSGRSRRLELKITIDANNDLQRALEVLSLSPLGCPGIQEEPAPQAVLLGFVGNAMELQLQAWVEDISASVSAKSELAYRADAALKAAGITLASPPRIY